MSTITYALNPFDTLLDGGTMTGLLVHDLPKDTEALHTQALAASGDYFEMLAASLEQIAVALPIDSVQQYQLQHHIGELLYLQRHYNITKKC